MSEWTQNVARTFSIMYSDQKLYLSLLDVIFQQDLHRQKMAQPKFWVVKNAIK